MSRSTDRTNELDDLPRAELRAIARELSAGTPPSLRPSAGFVGRVMAAVAAAPSPTPARAFAAALVNGSLCDATAALASAWRLASRPAPWVPVVVRAQTVAFLLVVLLATTGLAAGGAVGAAGLLGPDRWFPTANESPLPSPKPSPAPATRLETPAPVETDEPSDEPEGTPEESEEAGQPPEEGTFASHTPEAEEPGETEDSPEGTPDADDDASAAPASEATSEADETSGEASTPEPTETSSPAETQE